MRSEKWKYTNKLQNLKSAHQDFTSFTKSDFVFSNKTQRQCKRRKQTASNEHYDLSVFSASQKEKSLQFKILIHNIALQCFLSLNNHRLCLETIVTFS